MDFTSVDNSTAALINPKNHHLNGRNLIVEYASPDAVRRGGSKIVGVIPRKRRPLSAGYKKTRGRKKTGEGEAVSADRTDEKSTSAAQEGAHPPHIGKDSRTKKKVRKERSISIGNQVAVVDGGMEKKSRPKPGAALAGAKRETAAILPSQGKKIVF